MPRLYLETSVVSYLASEPSGNEIVAAHQLVTQSWWTDKRHEFEIFVSQKVIDEISRGDPQRAKKRLDIVEGLPVLRSTPDVRELMRRLVGPGVLPKKAAADALHLSIAVVNGIDFLVTWNCKHLANAHLRRKIEEACRSLGYSPSVICTPDHLLAEEDGHV